MIGIIILSGGQGLRMGGQDKGWCVYKDTTFIESVLQQLQNQMVQQSEYRFKLFISANRNLTDYKALVGKVEKVGEKSKYFGEAICDEREGYCGPLSGIESVMRFQQNKCQLGDDCQEIDRWITYPVDSPDVPSDYIELMLRLNSDSLTSEKIGYLEQNGRKHFAHLSVPSSQQAGISNYLEGGQRSIKGWLAQSGVAQAVLLETDSTSILNINQHSV